MKSCEFVDEAAVRAILAQKQVSTFFQPVVSIPAKSVIGFETFSRPAGESCSLDPRALFHEDLEPDLMIKMDMLCRGMALKRFKPFHDDHDGLLLFLKVNPEVFRHLEVARSALPRQLEEAGITPERVVIEFPPRLPYADRVLQFVALYRDLGVRIGLDGCSATDAYTNAVNRVGPEFAKVDRTFFGEGERQDHSSRCLETLLAVVDRAGGKVIGQGVESEEESIRLLSAGVHLQQGYYYTKDENAVSGEQAARLMEKIDRVNRKYKGVKKEFVRRKKEGFVETFRSVNSACSKLENLCEDEFEAGCKALLARRPEVLSVFILNADGVQVTGRIHTNARSPRSDTLLGTWKGTDHSAQDYVLYLEMGYQKFVTKPFVSAYGGQTACLITKPFYDHLGDRYTFCLEMPYPG